MALTFDSIVWPENIKGVISAPPMSDVIQTGIRDIYGNFVGDKSPSPAIKKSTSAITEFVSTLKEEGFQLNKPFLYNVVMGLPYGDNRFLGVLCHQATIPGWQVKTQHSTIYGLEYEVATKLQQDPVWLNFYVDRSFKIPESFSMYKKKMFNETNYSPRYKDEYSFQMMIQIIDTNNVDVVEEYELRNCFIRTLQQMPLNAAGIDQVQSIALEIIYEELISTNLIEDPLPNKIVKIGDTIAPPTNWDTLRRMSPGLAKIFDQTVTNTAGKWTGQAQAWAPTISNAIPNVVPNSVSGITNKFGL